MAAGLQNCALQETQPCSWAWEAAPGWPAAPRVGSCTPQPWLGCPPGLARCPRGCPCRLRPGAQPGAGARKWRTSNLWKESQACLKALQLTPGPFGTPSRMGFPEMTSQPVFWSVLSVAPTLQLPGLHEPGYLDRVWINQARSDRSRTHLKPYTHPPPPPTSIFHHPYRSPTGPPGAPPPPPLTVALGVTCT